MNSRYAFRIDVKRSLAMITVAGLFTPEQVRSFAHGRDEAYARLRSAPNQHVTLVDMQGMAIQTQETVNAFAQVLSEPTYQSRRLAFVVTTSLARMQIERAAAGRAARTFKDSQAARAWLLDGGA